MRSPRPNALLEQLRRLAGEAVPDATEAIKWGNAAWVHPWGAILFVLSGHAKHVDFAFTSSTEEPFEADLADFDTGKGTVEPPCDQPVPEDLLRRVITHRIHEHAACWNWWTSGAEMPCNARTSPGALDQLA